MSITSSIISFGLRCVFRELSDQIVGVIEKRFTDHNQALPKALSQANNRAWEAVGLALTGKGLFTRIQDVFRDADMKGIRDQIKQFLDNTPTGLEYATANLQVEVCSSNSTVGKKHPHEL